MPFFHRLLSAGLGLSLFLAAPAQAAELETVFFGNDADSVAPRAQAAIRRSPADPQGNAWLAECLMKEGRFEQARAALKKAGTGSLEGLLAHAYFAWYTGEWADALASYQQALERDADNLHAVWGIASAHFHLGHVDESQAWARTLEAKSTDVDPEFHAWVLVLVGANKAMLAERGNMLDKLNLAPQALHAFEQAVALAPKNPNALSALGRYYLLAPLLAGGDSGKAVETLRRADMMDPFFYLNDAYLIRALIADRNADQAHVEAAFYQAKFQGLPQPAAELAKIKF